MSKLICTLICVIFFTSGKGQIAFPDGSVNYPVVLGQKVSELDKAIFVIFQSKNSDYWFGSDGQGLYRYDGKTLAHFTTKDGLADDRIREIQEGPDGNIYINTVSGVSRFNGYSFTTLTAIKNNNAWRLQPGDLWFKCKQGDGGPYRYDGKNLYLLQFPKHFLEKEFRRANANVTYSPYDVYTIYKDGKGNIWFGTSNLGICRYDGKSLSWLYEKHLTETDKGGSFGIRSIAEDNTGKFWFCNNRYRYEILSPDSSGLGNSLIRYRRAKGIEQLSTPASGHVAYFLSIAKDDNGGLWMASYDSGVWHYDGKKLTHYLLKVSNKTVKLYSVCKDNNGGIWVGTHDAGAYKFNGKTFVKFMPRLN